MRIATAFYDSNGTLMAVPENMANPTNSVQVTAGGFSAVPTVFSQEVTMDIGYYHRFTDQYRTPEARDRAAADVQEILDLRNTTILEDNSHEYWFEVTPEDYDYFVKNNMRVPKPGKMYVLDVIYVVEEPWRAPFNAIPRRRVDINSVSPWINHDPIATSRGMTPLPDPAEATPDLLVL